MRTLHQAFVGTDQAIVVQRQQERQTLPPHHRSRRPGEPVVGVNDVGRLKIHNPPKGPYRTWVQRWRKVRTAGIGEQAPQSLKATPDPMYGQTVLLGRAGRPVRAERDDRHVVTASS